MDKIFIVGGGIMGTGMAQVFAQHGFETVLRVRNLGGGRKEKLQAGFEKSFGKLVKKGRMTEEEMNEALARITYTEDLADAADCTLVIEAIAEDLCLKKEVLAELDEICNPDTIFATNTSSLSITAIATATKRQCKFIGMHFFNPVHVMGLVEVIKGAHTTEETTEKVFEIVKAIGKTPVLVNEAPGFVVNRLLVPMINEAIFCLQEGVATAEDIDNLMRLGANHPMGPLALGDLIGLDVCLNIMDALYEDTRDSKYRACTLLRKMVSAGLLGRKTGKGFFDYNKSDNQKAV
ncbi:MAG TPA: 3-hydroxybutyryl-CoA dehydrogenase [Papillibacter sp.]|nr:3-hydroxybutyryl-CoA dehydrogenase [Papillibacter sp.]